MKKYFEEDFNYFVCNYFNMLIFPTFTTFTSSKSLSTSRFMTFDLFRLKIVYAISSIYFFKYCIWHFLQYSNFKDTRPLL